MNARITNTFPFNTKLGYYIPDSVKAKVYSVLTPDSILTKSFNYRIRVTLSQIPDYKYLGYGGALVKSSDEVIYISNEGEVNVLKIEAGSVSVSHRKGKLPGWVSVRDAAMTLDQFLYIYGVVEVENGCGSVRISRYPMVANKPISVKEEDIVWTSEANCKYEPKTAGGRIIISGDSLFVSTGIFQSPINSGIIPENWSQKPTSSWGKILRIRDGQATVWASGFRNPQGLFVGQRGIFATDHGPSGGDEVNKIKRGGNYGWPCKTYGRLYSAELNVEKDYPLPTDIQGCDQADSYQPPLYAFSRPSLGVSQGLEYLNGEEFPNFNGSFLVSSLKGKSIFRFMLNEDQSRVLSIDEINIGVRMRDILQLDNGKILIFSDKGYFGLLTKADAD